LQGKEKKRSRSRRSNLWYYVEDTSAEADTLKDKFYRDLEQGRVVIDQSEDLYTRVKSSNKKLATLVVQNETTDSERVKPKLSVSIVPTVCSEVDTTPGDDTSLSFTPSSISGYEVGSISGYETGSIPSNCSSAAGGVSSADSPVGTPMKTMHSSAVISTSSDNALVARTSSKEACTDLPLAVLGDIGSRRISEGESLDVACGAGDAKYIECGEFPNFADVGNEESNCDNLRTNCDKMHFSSFGKDKMAGVFDDDLCAGDHRTTGNQLDIKNDLKQPLYLQETSGKKERSRARSIRKQQSLSAVYRRRSKQRKKSGQRSNASRSLSEDVHNPSTVAASTSTSTNTEQDSVRMPVKRARNSKNYYYVPGDSDQADTLKDKFWRNLDQGIMEPSKTNQDLYTRVKSKRSRTETEINSEVDFDVPENILLSCVSGVLSDAQCEQTVSSDNFNDGEESSLSSRRKLMKQTFSPSDGGGNRDPNYANSRGSAKKLYRGETGMRCSNDNVRSVRQDVTQSASNANVTDGTIVFRGIDGGLLEFYDDTTAMSSASASSCDTVDTDTMSPLKECQVKLQRISPKFGVIPSLSGSTEFGSTSPVTVTNDLNDSLSTALSACESRKSFSKTRVRKLQKSPKLEIKFNQKSDDDDDVNTETVTCDIDAVVLKPGVTQRCHAHLTNYDLTLSQTQRTSTSYNVCGPYDAVSNETVAGDGELCDRTLDYFDEDHPCDTTIEYVPLDGGHPCDATIEYAVHDLQPCDMLECSVREPQPLDATIEYGVDVNLCDTTIDYVTDIDVISTLRCHTSGEFPVYRRYINHYRSGLRCVSHM